MGLKQTNIAIDIGFSQGTVSHELTRNKGLRDYRFFCRRTAMLSKEAHQGKDTAK